MHKLLARLSGRWLLPVLVAGFALTAAITVAVATLVTYKVINDYLVEAQDRRVGRDMDLAEAFYQLKLDETAAISMRMARDERVIQHLLAASQGQPEAIQIIDEQIIHKITVPTVGGTYLLAVLDAQGNMVAGRALRTNGDLSPVFTKGSWGDLPIVQDVLSSGVGTAATEIIPAEFLAQVGLDGQARVDLMDTPRAAPEPFDPREGTAGLALTAVHPVQGEDGTVTGAVLAAYLFNNDFTLVDRIQEVAGVDTVTIFFGDLRVSTNVLDEAGKRAIGTRVSQEVFDQVLVNGEGFTGPAFVVNQWYITRYEPLYDHQGQVVGSLYVGAKTGFLPTIGGFVPGSGSSHRRGHGSPGHAHCHPAGLVYLPSPDGPGHRRRETVTQGDWSVRVPANGRGEMGVLARSFNTMVETLQDTQERLVQKEKLASVGQLAAGVAHEINNPLGTVLLYADILHKETPEDNEQQREDLQMIVREATRCKAIVNDLLNFSRQNEVLAQETDLNDLLREMAEEVRQQGSLSAGRTGGRSGARSAAHPGRSPPTPPGFPEPDEQRRRGDARRWPADPAHAEGAGGRVRDRPGAGHRCGDL